MTREARPPTLSDRASPPVGSTAADGAAGGDTGLLVVDLDADLLRTDLASEYFWAGLSKIWGDWAGPAARPSSDSQTGGRVNAALLPLREDTLRAAQDWRQAGGRAVLVTPRSDGVAERIADHLDLFDGVVTGAGPGQDRIATRLGTGPVFGLHAVSGQPRPVEASAFDHIPRRRPLWGDLDPAQVLRAIRPHQWLKNLLIFIPILAAHRFAPDALLPAAAAFVAFCLLASGTYLLNDLLDLEADRAHPRKRHRPFASGRLSPRLGGLLLATMILAGATIAGLLGPYVLATLSVYLVGTVAYSLALKRLVIIDICTLAALYVLRIVAGGVATATPLSIWLIMFALFFFFCLAAVKRQGELVDLPARGLDTVVGRGYAAGDLPVITMLATSSGFVSALVFALFVNADATSQHYANPGALWGIVPILLYWVSRIVFLTQRGMMHDDPLIFAVRDRTSQLCLLLIVALAAGASVS